jgi:DNA/RNA-binding domain of Phe-tRNA-synthetase-like protein
MAIFRYSEQITRDFPLIRGGVVHITGLSNGPTPPSLLDHYAREQTLVREAIGDRPLSEIPSLSAWRRAFSSFGVKPTQYRSAAEALLRRLTKQGDIPSINLAVDIANLVSIRHRMPVAVFDLRATTGATTVRYSTGAEGFTDLGSDDVTHPERGEVIFVDEADLVSARRWCWRQSDQSATRHDTREALVTVEGQHENAPADVEAALEDLLDLFANHSSTASITSAILSPTHPEGP